MSSVDDRIVSMKFDNKQFLQGANTTERSLKGLDRTLANAGKGKGLTDLGAQATQTATKFSAMQVAGVAAIATIASKVTMAGINMAKSLTISPIMDGFKEYQTGLQSVQTIMANTGRPISEVKATLKELNKYSDQTIYNFGEMAKNIGTFTAAGVEMKQATSAIKGISNLAALSGSTSQQASTAMYQLSQAISAGKVGLQDWNSVVNAGMAGKQFKTALARTGVAMGKLSGDAVKVGTDVSIMGESFRNSISAKPGSESWLTSDILVATLATLDGRFSTTRMKVEGMNTAEERNNELRKQRIKLAKEGIVYTDKEFKAMKKMAEAAYTSATTIKSLPQLMDVIRESVGSMWASAFEVILGDFNQSKKLWTAVGAVIVGPTGLISKISGGFLGMLKDWAADGGRDKVLKGFERLGKGIKRIFIALSGAWKDVFPPGAGNVLVSISTGFKRLMLIFKPGWKTVDQLRSIFGGLFALLHIGAVIFRGIAGAAFGFFKAIFKGSRDTSGGFMEMLAGLGEAIKAFDKWLTSGGRLGDVLTGIGKVAGAALSPVLGAIGLVVKAFAALATGQGLSGFMEPLNQAKGLFLGFISKVLGGLAVVTAPFEKLSNFFTNLSNKIKGVADSFTKVTEPVDKLSEKLGGLDVVPSSLAKMDDSKLGKTFSNSIDRVGESADKIKDKAEGMYGSLSGKSASAAEKSTSTLASAGEHSASIFEKVTGLLAASGGFLKTAFSKLGDAIGWVVGQLGDLFGDYDAIEWVAVFNALFSGALILTIRNFVKDFGNVFGSVRGVFDSVGGTFDQLTDTLSQMQSAVKAHMIKNIAIGVALMVAALIALSFVPADKLMNSLAALAGIMAILVGTMAALGKINGDFEVGKLTASMVLMGLAMIAIATAITMLGNQDPTKVATGLGFMSAALGILTLAILGFSKMGGAVQGFAGSILLISIAMNLLVSAIAGMGLLPFDVVKQGLAVLAATMAILTVSLMALSGNSSKILAAGAAMVLMAVSMNMLMTVITALGLLPWGVVEQGLKGLAIGLGIMVAALLVLSGNSVSVLAAGAAMVMIAGAMNVLVSVLLILGAAPWDVVKQGLIGMGLALGILILAAAAAMFVLPGLQALGATILMIGAAMALAGAGMLMFGTGLAIIAVAGVAAVAVLVVAFHAFIALLPTIATQMAAAFVAFLQTIAAASPKIRKAVGTIIENILGIVTDAIPEIGKVFSALLEEGLRIITDFIPQYVAKGFEMIDKLLTSANDRVPGIVDTVTELAINFIDAIGRNAVKFANAGADVVIDTLNGLSDAIENRGDEIRAAAGRFARTFFDEIKEAFADMMSAWKIPMPDVGKAVSNAWSKLTGGGGGGPSGMSAPDSMSFAGIEADVTRVIREANMNIVNKTPSLSSFATDSSNQRETSVAARKQADLLAERAERMTAAADDRMSKAESKKSKTAAQKAARKKAINKAKVDQKAAKKVETRSAAAAKKADRQEMLATEKSERLSYEMAMLDNDDKNAKGDLASNRGADLAEKAQAALARANTMAAEAARLTASKSKADQALGKKMRKQAEKEAAEAKRWAADASEANRAATALYLEAKAEAAAAVRTRIGDVRTDRAAVAQAEADEAELKAATPEKKAEILNKRAAANEEKARVDASNANWALAQAEALADSDAERAAKYVDDAQAAFAAADAAAELAKQQREEAVQAVADMASANSSGGSSTGGSITPSRTALEDAAKAVSRYSESLSQAEESALAGSQPVQYVQNNYSPKALSSAEIYRNSKNLLSFKEVKIGAN